MNNNKKSPFVAYLRLGIRSAMPEIPAMMLPWEIMTPLGMPVEPLVYMMTAMSEGSGCFRSTATVREHELKGHIFFKMTLTHSLPIQCQLEQFDMMIRRLNNRKCSY